VSQYGLFAIQSNQPEAFSHPFGSYFLSIETTRLPLHLGNYLFDKAGLSRPGSAGEQIDLLH
jgi:hypothetical protein